MKQQVLRIVPIKNVVTMEVMMEVKQQIDKIQKEM